MLFQIFGSIPNPLGPSGLGAGYGDLSSDTGPLFFISNIVKFITIAAGLLAFINLIIAGFQYVSSQGDPKNTSAAWQRIYMSLLGLVILVSAITIISIISFVFLGEWNAILNPSIYGPGGDN